MDVVFESEGPGVFSERDRTLIGDAVRIAGPLVAREFGGESLDKPVRVFRNERLSEYATIREGPNEYVLDVSPDALQDQGLLRSTLGHEIYHGYDDVSFNPTIREQNAYRWEVRNAGQTGLSGRYLERAKILQNRRVRP